MRKPRTHEEWQDAVDAAEGALALNSAREYGLVQGGPDVHVDRCREILRQGAAKGYKPGVAAVERFAAEMTRRGRMARG